MRDLHTSETCTSSVHFQTHTVCLPDCLSICCLSVCVCLCRFVSQLRAIFTKNSHCLLALTVCLCVCRSYFEDCTEILHRLIVTRCGKRQGVPRPTSPLDIFTSRPPPELQMPGDSSVVCVACESHVFARVLFALRARALSSSAPKTCCGVAHAHWYTRIIAPKRDTITLTLLHATHTAIDVASCSA